MLDGTIDLAYMTKKRITLIGCLIFLIGVGLGAGVTWTLTLHVADQSLAYNAGAGAGIKLFVLDALHEGDSAKARTLLEASLEGDLVILSLVPDEVIDAPIRRVIRRAAEYRKKHPYKSGDLEVDKSESHLFRDNPSGSSASK